MTLIDKSAEVQSGIIRPTTKQVLGVNRIARPHGFIQEEPRKITTAIPPDCDEEKRLLGTLNLQYFTVQGQQIGGALGDIPVTLPCDTRFIMCVGANKLTDSCFMHFDKLNKTGSYGGSNAINPVGNENWFPFCGSVTKIGLYYFFEHKLPPIIYFDIGNESGTLNWNTFVVSNDDIEDLGSMFAMVA